MAKLLKNGKVSLKLHPDEVEVLILALKQAIEFDELELYYAFLLEEALEKLENGQDGEAVRLRKSELFALFDAAVMQYLDTPTQILIREAAHIKTTKQ